LFRKVLLIALVFAGALWAINTSIMSSPLSDQSQPALLAHRGVHQQYDRTILGRFECTATRWIDTDHPYLENTLTSMQAAFDLGADLVEIDIQRTADDQFAVFHDGTIECRTEGSGNTGDHTLAELQTLDVGYGYTNASGQYPLRGQGVGQLPSLQEVFSAFPEKKFLVNFKSGRRSDGELFAQLIEQHPQWRHNVWAVYGGHKPSQFAAEKISGLRFFSHKTTKSCLLNYLAKGWSTAIPKSCRNTIVMLPLNYAPLIWGWPYKFEHRMRKAGSTIILVGGIHKSNSGVLGIDTESHLQKVPDRFSGHIWTNRIEVIGQNNASNEAAVLTIGLP
jgi:glycerophosphoryl diester phosphodiesterase